MLPTSNACMAQVQVHQVQRNCCSNSCWKGWWRAVQLKYRPRSLCKQPGCWPQAPCMPPLAQTKHRQAGCRKAKICPPYDSSLMPWRVVSTSPSLQLTHTHYVHRKQHAVISTPYTCKMSRTICVFAYKCKWATCYTSKTLSRSSRATRTHVTQMFVSWEFVCSPACCTACPD